MQKEINSMTDREAMGLPRSFVASVFEDLHDQFLELRSASIEKLLSILSDKVSSLEYRYAAAQLLALVGDPRIDPFKPIMIDIPAAHVTIGINHTDVDNIMQLFSGIGLKRDWILKETPRFATSIEQFRIAKYPVTNFEYRVFLQETAYPELPSSWEFGIYPISKANHPVYSVSDEAAVAYTIWLANRTQRSFRLPTEVEWEYAASGNNHIEYPWGEHDKQYAANTLEEKIYASTPVGIFLEGASKFGVFDMAGNVEEYVSCYYQPYQGGGVVADDLLNTGKYRVTRGGSFTRYRDLARTSRRHGRYNKNIYVIGFRLAEDCE